MLKLEVQGCGAAECQCLDAELLRVGSRLVLLLLLLLLPSSEL